MIIKTFIYLILINFLFFFFFKYVSEKLKIYSYSKYSKGEVYKKIPLTGGLFILLNFNSYYLLYYFGYSINYNYEIFIILFLSNISFGVGYFDDKFNLRPFTKTLFFLIITAILLSFFQFLLIKDLKFSFLETIIVLDKFSLFFTLFCIFVFINALNMFDGINGHSAIYTTFVFIIFFLLSKNIIFIYFSLFLLIFLFLNLKEIFFIGNSGIFFLGTFISMITILFYNKNIISFSDEIFLMMFLPGVDLIRLFFVRILNKKSPFNRDLNHWHHIVSNKFGNNFTLLISILLICFPYTMSSITNLSNSIVIVLSFFIYFFVILFCKSKIKF